MKGYKVFNSDWTCRGFQYKVGETYEMDEEPIICKRGFHFCQDLKDCFYYYPLNEDVKIAEVEALGEINTNLLNNDTKYCTNKIRIIREIPFDNLVVETETKSGEFISDDYYDFGTLDIGLEKPAFIDGNIVLGGVLLILERTEIKQVNDIDVFRRSIPVFYTRQYKYTYLVNYTAITDVKEKPHEL